VHIAIAVHDDGCVCASSVGDRIAACGLRWSGESCSAFAGGEFGGSSEWEGGGRGDGVGVSVSGDV
jgi:hypothetical protein